ncbi:hypothetical protein HMPREF1020_03972, partial [Clostridium sp. 7_3_54FAA]
SESRNGKFRVKRKTSRKKLQKKSREIHAQIKKERHKEISVQVKKLNEILVGYYHYYGLTDNSRSIGLFYREVEKTLYKWLNRRSQKKSYTWEGFREMMKQHPLAKPKIYVSIYA